MWRLAAVLAALVVVPLAAGAAPAPRVIMDVGVGSSRDIASFAPDGSGYRDLSPALPSPTRVELDPSWSPDGTQIAWSSERDSIQGTELYVADADGIGVKRLTFSTGIVSNVQSCWLPDGRIAWARVTTQGSELWVMNADGTNQRALTAEGGQLYAPACSPTRDEIAYGRHQASGGRLDLRVVNADSGVARTIASAGVVAEPAWSPDGSSIAFADGRLHLVGADGTGLRDVSQAEAAGAVSWSSDGATIAATAGRTFPAILVGSDRTGTFPAATSDIVSIDVAGGAAKRLTGPLDDSVFDVRTKASVPTFWPGGARIYFTSSRDAAGPGGQLWQMNRDGTCESRVTEAVNVGRPWFRPGATPTDGPIQCTEPAVRATISKTLLGLRDVPHIVVTVENDGNEPAYPVLERSAGGGVLAPLEDGDCHAETCRLPGIAPGQSYTGTFAIRKLKAGTLTVNLGVRAAGDVASWNNDIQQTADVKPCYRLGTTGNDNLVGTNGVDRICGLPGWDHIRTLGGDDYIAGGTGADTIDPGAGNDTVVAGGGNDVIYARDGQRDWIDCGTEYDIVYADKLDHTHHCEKVLRR